MKKSLLALVAGLYVAAGAIAAPVVLDDWTASQSVTATSSLPTATSTLSSPVGGVASFLGDRTLEATLTSVGGSVNASIADGYYECNRSITADGHCLVSYDILTDVSIAEIEYVAMNDAAFDGPAAVSFYRNNLLIATQVIAEGVADYTTWLNTSFLAGDVFGIWLTGGTAVDQSLRPIEANLVPEPGSLALAGFALFAAGALNGRRKV